MALLANKYKIALLANKYKGRSGISQMNDIHDRIYPDNINKEGIDELRMHIYRYNFALKYTVTGGKTLDAGCGSGYGSRMLSFTSGQVIAIDRAEAAISHAKKHFPSDKIDYRVCETLDLQDDNFDTIIAMEMLEHNKNPEEIFDFLMSKLKVGKHGIFSLPVNSYAPGHLRIFSVQDIQQFFKGQTGFFFYQQIGDVSPEPIDDPLIITALILKT